MPFRDYWILKESGFLVFGGFFFLIQGWPRNMDNSGQEHRSEVDKGV